MKGISWKSVLLHSWEVKPFYMAWEVSFLLNFCFTFFIIIMLFLNQFFRKIDRIFVLVANFFSMLIFFETKLEKTLKKTLKRYRSIDIKTWDQNQRSFLVNLCAFENCFLSIILNKKLKKPKSFVFNLCALHKNTENSILEHLKSTIILCVNPRISRAES